MPHQGEQLVKQLVVVLPLVLIAAVVVWLGRGVGPEDLVPPVPEAMTEPEIGEAVSPQWEPQAADLGAGWEVAFEPEVFEPDELYAKINGGAEIYLSHGFEKLRVYSFLHAESGEFIELFLFDQGDRARTMYELEKPPSAVEDPELGGYFSGASLFAVRDNYYVQIQAASETDRTKEAVQTLATLVQKEL
jgi:hypothetical protein